MSRIEEALERARKEHEATVLGVGGTPAQGPVAAMGPPVPGGGKRVTPLPEVRLDPKLVAASEVDSPLGEEYRKLKERLVTLSKGSMNMFMVTSASMSEGKSLVSTNLAISFAQEFDNTALLIDADLRNPSCNELFGVPSSPGLSDCLLDGVPFVEAFVPTGVGRLSFLPAGRPVSNPGELFASSLMRDMMLEIKRRYSDRYIIIDTAPVLPFTETRILSRIVDGVILVARENTASLEGVRSMYESMQGANIMGVVYNDASHMTWPSGAYGENYGTYGGYGRRKRQKDS